MEVEPIRGREEFDVRHLHELNDDLEPVRMMATAGHGKGRRRSGHGEGAKTINAQYLSVNLE